MKKLIDLLLEIQGKTLHVYDFDDTLVDTNTSVNVIEPSGEIKKLSSGEFATYQLKSGEKYDFTDFDKMIKDSEPIMSNLLQMKKSLSNPAIKTTILTARRVAYPIMKHLKEKYKINVYVVGVGGANPELKADWIEKQVKSGYKNIKFVDDSEKNLLAVKNRLSKYKDLNLSLIDAKK
jgi:hypothetical protein